MIWKGLHNETYETSRELGRGGEGKVYELRGQRDLVLKEYDQPLATAKKDKLAHMVAMRSAAIEAYAAWPTDLVADSNGGVRGFIMRKLNGYVPLHSVFNPMDRKKLFPEKGYNFLVHVARNLATAFHKLHQSGLVVGDVNEGNILVNGNGLVALIDCDSFQVQGNGGYYYCEVGVPRYTPPELLKRATFNEVIRTTNTDNFSLAVLIFQLLFLGRHPFAGSHKSAADIDEETAIRQKLFAYSHTNSKKKLHPPKDSFALANLDDGLVTLFHKAFEEDERPDAAAWIQALDAQLADMVTCTWSPTHLYPAKLAECPWCRFRRERNIVYFPDDQYARVNSAMGDLEQFINGFRAERLTAPTWHGVRINSPVSPSPVPKRFAAYRLSKRLTTALVLAIVFIHPIIFSPQVSVFVIAAAILFHVHRTSGWHRKLSTEMKRRKNQHKDLRNRMGLLVREYEYAPELADYNNTLAQLEQRVNDYRKLPLEVERRKNAIEDNLRKEQLHYYLARFNIADHAIAGFGNAKKQALYDNGIYTASDIAKLASMKVPGIGPKNLRLLQDWAYEMSAGFVFIQDTYRIASEMNVVQHEIEELKRKLEAIIRRDYQSLTYGKQQILARWQHLEKQINEIATYVQQAEMDIAVFRKYMW